jgi:hypothetical protein
VIKTILEFDSRFAGNAPTLALNSRDPKITKIIARLAQPDISWHTAFHVFITSNN